MCCLLQQTYINRVCCNEICLSIMLTSIKHPLVYSILILADVGENAFCLYSLYRIISKNKIVPALVGDSGVVEKQTLTKRTSSVYKVISTINDATTPRERQGTVLFIAATLLQREAVETLVPFQALGVISFMYAMDVKSNSITSSWSDSNDYYQALMYTGIDLGIELIVFIGTVLVLRRMFPELSPMRILSGLVKMHYISMFMLICVAWLGFLLFQNFLSGMDTTFRFEWLRCEKNSTWLGGYDWEC